VEGNGKLSRCLRGFCLMRRRDANEDLPRVNMLKIDKDCVLHKDLERRYIRHVVNVCRAEEVKVLRIRSCLSARHGVHYYIDITPSLNAKTANELQLLCGDDSRRYGYNKARVESKLVEWSKLFERPNTRLRTIYHLPSVNSARHSQHSSRRNRR